MPLLSTLNQQYRSQSKWGLITGLGVLVIALILVGVQLNFINNSLRGQGTVIKNASHISTNSNGNVYAPVVSFKTADGRVMEFEEGTRSNPPAHQIGETVEVFYKANNPKDAQINSPFDLWLAPMIMGAIGVFFLMFNAIFYFGKQK